MTITPLYGGNLWSPGPKRLIGVQLYIRRLDATLPPQYSQNLTPMDKMRPPGVTAISLNPLTDKLLNFDSTYLLDVASIIGRLFVQLLVLRSKALGYRQGRWRQAAVQLA